MKGTNKHIKGYINMGVSILNNWLMTCENNSLVWFSNSADEPYNNKLFTKVMTINEIKELFTFRKYNVIGTYEIKRDTALGLNLINALYLENDKKTFIIRSVYIFKSKKPKI